MTEVLDMEKARRETLVKKAFRNWKSRFGREFESRTRLSDISPEVLAVLVLGHEKDIFYIYDLITNLLGLGSGFQFLELPPQKKMAVMERYLFLLDRIRFEYMKRLGWLEEYPGENYSLVDLVLQFEDLGPDLQARVPVLSKQYPAYDRFSVLGAREKEEFIRKLIPKALSKLRDQSTTL